MAMDLTERILCIVLVTMFTFGEAGIMYVTPTLSSFFVYTGCTCQIKL